jgi:DNA processing protein
LDIEVINQFEDTYPKNLLTLRDSPSILYLKGNLDLIKNITIGIIGTRKPNSNGVKIAEKISAHYFSKDWNICNGLAEGIDKASIMNNGKFYSKVIGVVAGGLNFNQRKTLLQSTLQNADKILEAGGLIVSEESLDKKEDTFTVVKSCRIQAGLSDGLILIQSSKDGGSKFTLKSFAELGRPLAVINPLASDLNDPSYEANKLIIENRLNAIETITDLKGDKIKMKGITIFNSKLDYDSFDLLVSQSDGLGGGQSSLFN